MNACKILLAALGLAALFSAGLAVRRAVLAAQFEQYGRPLQFNLESALEFRYVRMLFDTGRIPRLDQAVQAPEGVIPRETYTLGAEYVYAAAARLLPSRLPLDERVRWIAAAWFCLGIPLMSLWLWAWTRSAWAAGLAGAYYAVALAAVMRSTGQELQHENFALPFLIAHWALGAWANRTGKANIEHPKTDAGRQTTDAGPNTATSAHSAKWPLAAQGGDGDHRLVRHSPALPDDGGTPNTAFFILSLLSALMLACAVSFWDLMQFYVLLWSAGSYIRFVSGKYFSGPRARLAWLTILLALAGAGIVNPYLRAHAFASSFAMLLAYGVALGLGFERLFQGIENFSRLARHSPALPDGGGRKFPILVGGVRPLPDAASDRTDPSPRTARLPQATAASPWNRTCDPSPAEGGMARRSRRRVLILALAALLPLIAGALLFQTYGETYGHFIELLQAKLQFLNRKPADPALLTFDQRILWTAPLNSASFLLTAALFPVTLWLFVLAGVIALRHLRARPDPELAQLLGYTIVSLLAFVFFMRFHVFLILGFAALIGWLGYWVSIKRTITRWLILVLLLAGAGLEAAHVMNNPARWGSVPAYPDEKRELCRWLRSNTSGESVLANFGLSASLLTYADCPIVLHPKFESRRIRERVRAYGEALFKSDEEGFRGWMEPFGAPYYVYALGEFADIQPESQMRYCVNALNPPPAAAARLFETQPDRGRYFRFLWGNAKYRVFRVITRADELRADRLAAEAGQALRQGRKADAEIRAEQSLMYDPHNTNAMQVLLGMR